MAETPQTWVDAAIAAGYTPAGTDDATGDVDAFRAPDGRLVSKDFAPLVQLRTQFIQGQQAAQVRAGGKLFQPVVNPDVDARGPQTEEFAAEDYARLGILPRHIAQREFGGRFNQPGQPVPNTNYLFGRPLTFEEEVYYRTGGRGQINSDGSVTLPPGTTLGAPSWYFYGQDSLGSQLVPLVIASMTGAGLAGALPGTAAAFGGGMPGMFAAGAVPGAMLGGSAENPGGAITGGLKGGITGVIGGLTSQAIPGLNTGSQIADAAIKGAAIGGVKGLASGGDVQSAVRGAISGGAGGAANTAADMAWDALKDTFTPAAEVPVAPTAPQSGMLPVSNITPDAINTEMLVNLSGMDPAVISPQDVGTLPFGELLAEGAIGLNSVPQDGDARRSQTIDDIPVDPTADDQAGVEGELPRSVGRQIIGYAKLAKQAYDLYEALTGRPSPVQPYMPSARREGESDEQYGARVADETFSYLDLEDLDSLGIDVSGLDPAALSKQYTPGSPEYMQAVLGEIDSIIEQMFGFDPAMLMEGESVGDIQEAIRGKTAGEQQALQRALFARGGLASVTANPTAIDPFGGMLEDISGAGSPISGPTAAHQRGVARFGRELAESRPSEARGRLDEFLSRDPDLFGMREQMVSRRKRDEQMALLLGEDRRRRERGSAPRGMLDFFSAPDLDALYRLYGLEY